MAASIFPPTAPYAHWSTWTIDQLASAMACLHIPATEYYYTDEELVAVPAVVFPKFRILPLEVQMRIWFFNEPDVLVEAAYDDEKMQYVATIIRNPAPPGVPSYKTVKSVQLHPIFLREDESKKLRAGPRPKIEPLWIRTSEILYLPKVHLIDTESFLERDENQKIENIALSLREPYLDQHYRTIYKLIHGLKNLQNLYILQNQMVNAELEDPLIVSRDRRELTYKFSWSMMVHMSRNPRRKPDGKYILSLDRFSMSRERTADSLEKKIKRNVFREGRGRRERGWVPPNLFFRNFVRTPMSHGNSLNMIPA